MKITLNLTWAIFWIGFFAVLIALTKIPIPPSANDICIKNNGIPIPNSWGQIIDCKLIKK